jgi:predicted nucleic acid-binding Zn ribbon protein
MSEVVHSPRYGKGRSDLTRYSYMCDECGVAFKSLDEFVEHYKDYHPGSIGTAIT